MACWISCGADDRARPCVCRPVQAIGPSLGSAWSAVATLASVPGLREVQRGTPCRPGRRCWASASGAAAAGWPAARASGTRWRAESAPALGRAALAAALAGALAPALALARRAALAPDAAALADALARPRWRSGRRSSVGVRRSAAGSRSARLVRIVM